MNKVKGGSNVYRLVFKSNNNSKMITQPNLNSDVNILS